MTIEIARHLRIVKADLDDDYVEKRKKAVAAVAESFRKSADAKDVLALAEAIARILHSSTLDVAEDIKNEVASAISAEAPSFIAEDATLEIGVCALLAAALAITAEKPANGDTFNVVWFAGAITLGIAALPPRSEARIEGLRMDLVGLAVGVTEPLVERSRKRDEANADLPPIKEGETPDGYAKRLFEAIGTVCTSLVRKTPTLIVKSSTLFGGLSAVAVTFSSARLPLGSRALPRWPAASSLAASLKAPLPKRTAKSPRAHFRE